MVPDSSKILIAVDCWTNPTNKAFLAVTCYFFTEGFDYKEALLGFEPLHGSYDAKYLADRVLDVLGQHDFLSQVLAATTDNATNNNKITEDYNTRLQDGMDTHHRFQSYVFDPQILQVTESATYIPCLVHVIQLLV